MEHFLKYLEVIPPFFVDVVKLFTSPKAFLRTKNNVTDLNWTNALVFFAILSILPILIASNVQSAGGNFLIYVAANITLSAVAAFSVTLAIHISWRLVGRQASFNAVLLTNLYGYPAFVFILTCLTLILAGFMETHYPEYYKKLMETYSLGGQGIGHGQEIDFRSIPLALKIVYSINSALILIWLVAVWGAYRELYRASRARSLVAFLICGVMATLSLYIVGLLAIGGSLPGNH